MNKKQKKISTIRLMMIISQLLLSVFMGYWIYTQFIDHKKLLSEELERGFRKSEEQVIDSLLATNLIDPFLNDTGNFSMYMIDHGIMDTSNIPANIKFEHDSPKQIFMQFSGDTNEFSGYSKHSKQIRKFGVSLFDSIPDQTSITIQAQQNSDDSLLLHSVKLFINSIGKFTADEGIMSSYYCSNIDTSLLKKVFNDFLEYNYNGFSVDWISANDSVAVKNELSGIFLNSYLFENSFGPIINSYQIYLLKSISTQIVFAILLLFITAIAFRMAYISLKSQRKLIVIKNDFISNISHELKTPVSTVKVALEALLDFDMKKDPKMTKEYLEMAHSEMNRLDLLVNQVLNNSALEDGNKFIFPQKINLKTLVDEVLHSMKSRFDQQEAEINFQLNEEIIEVYADKLHVHGVIVNLIDNSLKYTRLKPKISIDLSQNEKETKLTVSDNGIGIPDEYLNKVFEKFFRVPTGDKHNVKGYGLGLNYATLVMKHHGGKISVENLDEGGCKFSLSFPNLDKPELF